MKSFLKILFNSILYIVLLWGQWMLVLFIYWEMGIWDPLNPSRSYPGFVSLICFYTSYLILKRIHKIKKVESFFNEN